MIGLGLALYLLLGIGTFIGIHITGNNMEKEPVHIALIVLLAWPMILMALIVGNLNIKINKEK